MAPFKLRHVCFTVVLFSIALSSCRGQGGGGGAGAGAGGGALVPGTQDAIQIVAQAALCFDNRPVINGCLQAMGINVTGNGANTSASSGAPAPAPAANGSTASICSAPCFGQMTMMMGCVNGILGNIQGYSPGLMQGVQAVFQMACGNVNGQGGGGGGTGGGGGGAGGTSGGGGGGATNVSAIGGSHMAINSPGQPTSSADGPTASLRGICSWVLITCAGVWIMAF